MAKTLQFRQNTDQLVIPTTTLKNEYFSYWDRYVSMDLGIVHNTVILFGYYDFLHATIVIQKEWYMSGPRITTDLIAKTIKDTELELWGRKPPYLRVADSNNLLLLNDLGIIHDLPVLPTNKDNLYAVINLVRMWVKAKRIVIDPSCQFLINSIAGCMWDKQRKKFGESKVFGHGDAVAALMYLVRNLNEYHNPVPDLIDFNPDQQFILNPPENINTSNASALEGLFN